VTESSFWVGCHPGLTGDMVDWIAESLRDFLLR
jgi:dTDP-4-dehydro-2,6-dideoxy-D-glucose 3-dehydratase